ncbi:MAG: hypothetical protein C4584_00030 [Armatimonadetes bacterium]|nr:MAG: hypothetical protein C4584_00030 [Armatimonadota bacterium]
MLDNNVIFNFSQLLPQVGIFLLNLLGAILILVIGWLIAVVAGQAVETFLRKININSLFDRMGVSKSAKAAGFEVDVAGWAGLVVNWFIIIIFLVAVADSLNLPQISAFINQVALYLPNVIAAVAIIVIGVFVADVLSDIVYGAASAAKLAAAELIRAVTSWSILIFTFFAALTQLQLAENLIQILFSGIVVALAIALGLAFGLGGQDKAKEIIGKVSQHTSRKK